MLTKWVAAGGVSQGLALEATVRMKKQREILETDKGKCVGPDVVPAYFHGDAVRASSFMRESPRGVLIAFLELIVTHVRATHVTCITMGSTKWLRFPLVFNTQDEEGP